MCGLTYYKGVVYKQIHKNGTHHRQPHLSRPRSRPCGLASKVTSVCGSHPVSCLTVSSTAWIVLGSARLGVPGKTKHSVIIMTLFKRGVEYFLEPRSLFKPIYFHFIISCWKKKLCSFCITRMALSCKNDVIVYLINECWLER